MKQEDELEKLNNFHNEESSSLVIRRNKYLVRQAYIKEIFERMNFTRYHFFLILSIFLIRTVDGTEVISLSLASEMIENSFKLPSNSSSYINVIILSGNLTGCLVSMWISNKRPRKFLIYFGLFLILVFGLASILTRKIILFVIFRHLVNIGISVVYVATASLATESINPNYRGFVLNVILVASSSGEIFISLCLNNIIDLENPHDWSKIFLLSITPVFIGSIFVPFYPDSMLYYIEKKNYREAYKVCKVYFSNFNESEEKFEHILKGGGEDFKELISNEITNENFNENAKDTNQIKENNSSSNISSSVLSEKTRESLFIEYSIIMSFAFFNAFLGQGIRYILPKTLTHVYHLKNFEIQEDNLKEYYTHNAGVVSLELQLSSVASGIVSFMTGILIDNTYFKRLKLLRIGIFISTVFSILAYSIKNNIDTFACLLKAMISLQDIIIDIYSVETFETKRRVVLLSIYNIIQSCSSFISPYFNDLITYHWFRLNYLMFSILLTICFLLSLLLGREKIKNILT